MSTTKAHLSAKTLWTLSWQGQDSQPHPHQPGQERQPQQQVVNPIKKAKFANLSTIKRAMELILINLTKVENLSIINRDKDLNPINQAKVAYLSIINRPKDLNSINNSKSNQDNMFIFSDLTK